GARRQAGAAQPHLRVWRRQRRARQVLYQRAVRTRNDRRARFAQPAVRQGAARTADRARISVGAAARADLQAVSRHAGPRGHRIDQVSPDSREIAMKRHLLIPIILALSIQAAAAADPTKDDIVCALDPKCTKTIKARGITSSGGTTGASL